MRSAKVFVFNRLGRLKLVGILPGTGSAVGPQFPLADRAGIARRSIFSATWAGPELHEFGHG